ncbi:unnamed protein product [Heterobilharzia americana]|nr:unnamed protein product [Heterobilharzia americana]
MVHESVVHAAKIKGLSREVRIKDVKKFFKPMRIKDFRVIKNGMGIIYFRNSADLCEALKKKGEIYGRPVKISEHIREKGKICNFQSSEKPNWPVKTSEDVVSAILETGRLFVRNLSYNCTEQDLEKLFSPFGSLSDIHLAFDSWSQISKGFAFITFLFPSDAVKAYKSLDKTKFMGRLIHIIPGQECLEPKRTFGKSSSNVQEDGNLSNPSKMLQSSFKSGRFEDLKKSSNVGHNWNALFIRPDAVATYLAAKFGLTMEQVLDPSGNKSVAVRLAHGETQLIAEMKEFLQIHGVRLEAFEKHNDEGGLKETGNNPIVPEASGHRNRLELKSKSTIRQLSGTAFLIKNLPAGTTECEVRELLKQYTKSAKDTDPNIPSIRSGLKRVLVPPLGITAIVEYAHSQQARLMYKALAYEPFRDSVLFLQWLPDGALKPASVDRMHNEEAESEETTSKKRTKVKRKHSSVEEVKIEQSDSEFELVTSVPTDEHKLMKKKHEEKEIEPPLEDDSNPVKTEKPSKIKKYLNKKQRIEQQTKESVKLEANNNLVIHKSKKIKFIDNGDDENFIHLQSKKNTHGTGNNEQEKVITRKPSSKQLNNVLIVRNVPFQATQKELVELFQPVGGLINVRLPKKATGGHRGFAFIEFDTLDKAKR